MFTKITQKSLLEQLENKKVSLMFSKFLRNHTEESVIALYNEHDVHAIDSYKGVNKGVVRKTSKGFERVLLDGTTSYLTTKGASCYQCDNYFMVLTSSWSDFDNYNTVNLVLYRLEA